MSKDVPPRRGLLGWLGAVWRLFWSSKTPVWAKLLFGIGALVYLSFPWDAIPDIFLGVGQLDDLVVVPTLLWLATKFAHRPEQKHPPHRRKKVVNERVIRERKDDMKRSV